MTPSYPVSSRVLYVTHDPNIRGGIEEVTRMFMRRFPNFSYLFSVSGRRSQWLYRSYYLLAWFRFLVRLLLFRPSVVHLNLGMPQDILRNLPYIWLARIHGTRLLIQTHMEIDWEFPALPRPVRAVVRWSMRLADLFVFLTPALERAVREFAPDVSTATVPNSIPDRFFADEPLPVTQRRDLIVYLGRFHPQKGSDVLASAALLHVAADPTVTYELHGYGPVAMPSHERILVKGWIGLDEKITLLREAKLVVMPSRVEAFGLLIPEAMACGTPIVATRVGGIPDVTADGIHGLLVAPEAPDGLLAAMQTILADNQLWERMSEACRQESERYREETITRFWETTYELLLAGHQALASPIAGRSELTGPAEN